jgi:DNA-binding transcriptional LysR family regulator
MDFRQLQLLKDVVEAGSLSKVCAARGVAQSALSKQIMALEQDFGARLFYRTGRGVVLTEFGQAVMPRVHTLLADCELLRAEVRARAGVPSGPVRLAVQASITQLIVGSLFQRVRRDFPRIELRLMEGFAGHIEELLAHGRADVGVFSRYGDQRLRTDEALATDDLFLVGPLGHTWVSAEVFPFRDLGKVPLVLPGMPDGLRLMLTQAARQAGIELDMAIEVDSLTAMKEIVATGGGYTVLTRQAVAAELELGRLAIARIVEPVLTRTLVLATTTHHPLTSASRAVADLIRRQAHPQPAALPECSMAADDVVGCR